jgi:hypothetical protein
MSVVELLNINLSINMPNKQKYLLSLTKPLPNRVLKKKQFLVLKT